MDDNYVSIVGRLVVEPEFRVASTGTSVTNLRFAQNDRKKDENGNWVDGDAHYFDAVAFKSLAEKAAELPVGTAVRVTGRLVMDSWTTPDGDKRSRLKIIASSIDAVVAGAKSIDGSRGHLSLTWGSGDKPKPVNNGIENAMFGQEAF